MASEKKADIKKLGLIGGGVLAAVLVAVYFMTSRSESLSTDPTAVTARNVSGEKPTDVLDPEYRKLTELYNQQQSDRALNNGTSFVGMGMNNQKIPQLGNTEQPFGWQGKEQTPSAGNGAQTPPGESEQEKRRNDRLAKLLEKIEEARTPAKEIKTGTALFASSEKDGNKQNQWVASIFKTGEASGQNGDAKAPATPAVTLIKALSAFPGVVDSATNSDSRKMKLLAHIASGKYQGARLFSTDMSLEGDGVEVKFTTMEWNGEFYNVEAYAVNAETREFAVASEVNNRWFSRILLPAIASGIGQTGQLYRDSNSQMILTPGGNEYRTTGDPSGKAITGTIAGGIAEQAGKVMAEDASKLPVKQVTVNKGKVIGIQFIKAVTDADKVTR
ncbi:conjugal transfer protein TraO [Serratia marcescens]|nr:conjugal transfer protein TraO [Serratia marcescens]